MQPSCEAGNVSIQLFGQTVAGGHIENFIVMPREEASAAKARELLYAIKAYQVRRDTVSRLRRVDKGNLLTQRLQIKLFHLFLYAMLALA